MVAVNWVWSVVAYVVLCVATLWACFKWQNARTWRVGSRVLLLVAVLALFSGLGAWGTITEYQREHPVKYIKLPGMAMAMRLRINNLPADRRKYILDFGQAARERLSVYISADSIFTLLFTDIKGEPHVAQIPLGGSGMPFAEYFTLICEIGVDGQSTHLYVTANGVAKSVITLPFRVDVSLLDIPNGVVGADLTGINGGAFDLIGLMPFTATLDDRDIDEINKNFAQASAFASSFRGDQWMRVGETNNNLNQDDSRHRPFFDPAK